MATSVHDICTGALQNIGAVAIEETPTAAELIGAMNVLNNMIEAWNTESLAVPGVRPETFALAAGQATRTIGTGGDFNTARPVRIVKARIKDAAGTEYDCEVTENYDYYASIIVKSTQSVLPTLIYDDGGFPLKTLYFWPVPSDASYSVVLWNMEQISGFTSLSDNVIVQPGCKRALEYNLSIELGPKYGKKATADLIQLAIMSKADLKRSNYTIGELKADPGLVGSGGRPFNWLTGE